MSRTVRFWLSILVTFFFVAFCMIIGEAMHAADVAPSSRITFLIAIPGITTITLALIWSKANV